jgi:hypothetical protein
MTEDYDDDLQWNIIRFVRSFVPFEDPKPSYKRVGLWFWEI